MVRKVLRGMLYTAGFGKSGRVKKLGVGDPPLGWPVEIRWQDFSGSTSSKLTIPEVTNIIISMLQAAGHDPATYVIPPEEEELEMMVDPVTGEVRLVDEGKDDTDDENGNNINVAVTGEVEMVDKVKDEIDNDTGNDMNEKRYIGF